jgi:hypothetical protein
MALMTTPPKGLLTTTRRRAQEKMAAPLFSSANSTRAAHGGRLDLSQGSLHAEPEVAAVSMDKGSIDD